MVDEIRRQRIAKRLAELYDRPIGSFTAIVDYFETEDEDQLAEAIRRHVENNPQRDQCCTYQPAVARD